MLLLARQVGVTKRQKRTQWQIFTLGGKITSSYAQTTGFQSVFKLWLLEYNIWETLTNYISAMNLLIADIILKMIFYSIIRPQTTTSPVWFLLESQQCAHFIINVVLSLTKWREKLKINTHTHNVLCMHMLYENWGEEGASTAKCEAITSDDACLNNGVLLLREGLNRAPQFGQEASPRLDEEEPQQASANVEGRNDPDR